MGQIGNNSDSVYKKPTLNIKTQVKSKRRENYTPWLTLFKRRLEYISDK